MTEIIDEEFKAPVLQDIKYPLTIEALEQLVKKYENIPDIDLDAPDEIVAEQFKFVITGHKAMVRERNRIEKTRKIIKEPAFTFGKSVDAYAKKLQAIIKDTETNLKYQRDKVEQNESRKQREAEQAEELRVENIKKLIADIKSLAGVHYNSNSEQLSKALESLTVPNEEIYEEFLNEAREAQKVSIIQLEEMRKSKILAESAEKLEAERAEKAKQLEAERDAKFAKEREEFEEQQRAFKKQQDEFIAQQREQQEIIDRQKAEHEADELQAKQEAEREEREKQNREKMIEKRKETFNALDYQLNSENVDIETLIDLIQDEQIPNIKWSN